MPEGAINVAGEKGYAGIPLLSQDGRRLIRARSAWEDHLRWKGRIVGHDTQHKRPWLRRPNRHAVLGAGQQRRTLEILEDRVPPLDAHIAVAERADCGAGDARPEEVGQSEVVSWGAPFTV